MMVNEECKYHTVLLMIIISGSPRTCNESQSTMYIVTIYNLYRDHTRVVPIIAYSSPRVE